MDAAAARRKEWRAVPHETPPPHPHSDERTIYEEGAGPPAEVGDEMLRERLGELVRKQEELRQMEVGLRVRAMVAEVQGGYEARVKEHAEAAAALKEQLQERERHLREMGAKLDEKDRELRAVKIDNEAAWAKEDLLREQNKEIASFRRERDNLEAERAQHLQKIHELQEHIQEKDSQFLALEEQHRVAQETIIFKDEQLREAQTWIARAQEMDALHSTANQALQVELRDRTEQFNQYWIGFQRQCTEVERHHLQTIQHLQLELAEAREHKGVYKDGSRVARENSVDGSTYVQNKGSLNNVNGGATSNGNLSFMSNGTVDTAPSFVSATSASSKTEHGVPVVPSSILGVNAFLPPLAMHPQGAPSSVAPANPPNFQSHMARFQTVPPAPVQHWPNEQAVPDTSQATNLNKYEPSQTEQHLLRSNAQYSYQNAAERQVIHSGNPDMSTNNHLQRSGPVINSSNDGVQVPESNGNQYRQGSQESQETSNAHLQLKVSLGCDPPKKKSDAKVQDEKVVAASNQAREQVMPSSQQQTTTVSEASSTGVSHPVSSSNATERTDTTQKSASSAPVKAVEPKLLDERQLLACIVRAIPAGSDGRIRISSTLTNRLGKMLAPLHWHDYKKSYGKLDEFVTRHPELFVIEGDLIHLREGAQEIISATTACAKVAAAAASSAPYSTLLPSVAVTPVAQNNRHKKAASTDLKPLSTALPVEGTSVPVPATSHGRHSHNVKLHSQLANGIGINTVQGLADVSIANKTKDLQELNGVSEVKSGHSSIHNTVGNGSNPDRANFPPSQNNGSSNGRNGFGGRQQGRSSVAGLISRRQN